MADKYKDLPEQPLTPIKGIELFFGIVGPLGVDLDLICRILSEELDKVTYTSNIIRLSSLLSERQPFKDLPKEPEERRIEAHMKAGTALRSTTGRGDILALMSVSKIRQIRQTKNKDPQLFIPRAAYIFRSLKHPDEVKALRAIYGNQFFLISAYAPRRTRVKAMAKIIADKRNDSNHRQYLPTAEQLVLKDETEEGEKLGQDVSDAFPLADLFVDVHNESRLRKAIARFIEILFGYPFHTPTQDEMGMYLARSTALRSADLSRQVGAAICNPRGQLICVGCNEVPTSGGGAYWPGDDDFRDFQVGLDSSAEYKQKIIKEVISRFKERKLFANQLQKQTDDEIVRWLLEGEGGNIFSGAQIFDLLEFGRPVHAEMAAITEASQRGVSVDGCTLYSTTFPCHMCARHIISSGLKKVVYV